MTLREDVSDIGNVNYTFSDDGIIGYGHLSDGTIFMFDADLFSRIKDGSFANVGVGENDAVSGRIKCVQHSEKFS